MPWRKISHAVAWPRASLPPPMASCSQLAPAGSSRREVRGGGQRQPPRSRTNSRRAGRRSFVHGPAEQPLGPPPAREIFFDLKSSGPSGQHIEGSRTHRPGFLRATKRPRRKDRGALSRLLSESRGSRRRHATPSTILYAMREARVDTPLDTPRFLQASLIASHAAQPGAHIEHAVWAGHRLRRARCRSSLRPPRRAGERASQTPALPTCACRCAGSLR